MVKILEAADEAVMNKDDTEMVLASQISLNIKGEWDAIEGYNKLLTLIDNDEDRAVIEEIISDEKNHSMKLQNMLSKYDGDIQVNND